MLQILSKHETGEDEFLKQALRRIQGLYSKYVKLTKSALRGCDPQHVIWMEDGAGATIAATTVCRFSGTYRVFGLAVDPRHQRRKYGTTLLLKAIDLVPKGVILEIGVDTGTPDTEWLAAWYRRVGFIPKPVSSYEDEITLYVLKN